MLRFMTCKNSCDLNVRPNQHGAEFTTQALTPQLDLHHHLRVETRQADPFLPWPSGRLWAMIWDALNPKVSTGGECSEQVLANMWTIDARSLLCAVEGNTCLASAWSLKSVFSLPIRWGFLGFMSAGLPPPLNSNLWIKVIPAGPQLQALDQSVPRRTSTASSGSERSPPDLRRKLRIRAFPGGPPPQAADQSVPRRTPTASSGSECSPRDLNHKESPKIYQIECQKRMSE